MRLAINIPDKYVPALQAAAEEVQRSLSSYIVAVMTGAQPFSNMASVVSGEREVRPTTSSPTSTTNGGASKRRPGEADEDPYEWVEPRLPANVPPGARINLSAFQERCKAGEFKTHGEMRAAEAQEKTDGERRSRESMAKEHAYAKFRREELEAATLQKEEQDEMLTPEEHAARNEGPPSMGFNPVTNEWDLPIEHKPTCGCAVCHPEHVASYLRKVIAYHRDRARAGLPIYDTLGMRFTTEQVFAEDYHPFRDRSPVPPSHPTLQEITAAEDITNVPSLSLTNALEERAQAARRKDFRVVKSTD